MSYSIDLMIFLLFKVREELLQSIHETEEGILLLKRARLLREADDISSKLVDQPTTRENYENLAGSSQLELGPLVSAQFHVGSKCRFLHPDDGHWYNGHIVELEEGALARVAFMNPTSENMLVRFSICLLVFCISIFHFNFSFLILIISVWV